MNFVIFLYILRKLDLLSPRQFENIIIWSGFGTLALVVLALWSLGVGK